MTIPTMKSDDLRQFIREGVINKMVEKAKEQFEEVVEHNLGYQCVVDTRIFAFTTTDAGPSSGTPSVETNWASFDVELDDDEFPVRAVVRTFNKAQNKGTYERCLSTEYDRTTHKLLVDTGPRTGPGEVYVELWKQTRKP